MVIIFFFCVILNVCVGQSYMNTLCFALLRYSSGECTNYEFNEIDCFPWNLQRCKFQSTYDPMCDFVECRVSIKVTVAVTYNL